MISSMKRLTRSLLAAILIGLSTAVHVTPLLLVAVVKMIFRTGTVRRWCDRWLMRIAENWIGFNSWMIDHLTDTRIEVEGMPDSSREGHLLVLCNHQSWVDIPVLQKLFNRRLPLLRFFLKSQLIWVPLLGLAWWALDFPFMKRYSKQMLARRPELAGRDVEATRKACAKFRDIPVAIMNFVEGTRFRPDRHQAQQSPYRHLLKPRSGGIAFVFDALGDSIDTIVDVTIAYPGFDRSPPGLPDLFANRITEIRVSIRTLQVPDFFRDLDYQNDPADRQRFQAWVNGLWRQKDETCERLLAASEIDP
ncbi:MAG: acyltransferase [Wenzhouxiangellaceae bacterium]|nr:acyltransferase [Wenzhouxiangellaceae bacterium]